MEILYLTTLRSRYILSSVLGINTNRTLCSWILFFRRKQLTMVKECAFNKQNPMFCTIVQLTASLFKKDFT